MIWKWTVGVLFFLITAAFLLYLAIQWVLHPPSGLEQGSFSSPGIAQELVIERRADDTPVIRAGSTEDALFGMGYAHARDFLWPMYIGRRAAEGAASEIWGDYFEDADLLARLITGSGQMNRIPAVADSLYPLLESYTEGINTYIRGNPRKYPVQFTLSRLEPEFWTVTDVIRYYNIISWVMNADWRDDLSRALINRSIPESLLPYIHTDEYEVLDVAIPDEPVLWLLEADLKLRKLLNSSPTLPPVRWIVTSDSNLSAAFQNGTNRTGFWSNTEIILPNNQISGVTVPGIPAFWSGQNNSQTWVFDEKRAIPVQTAAPTSDETETTLIIPAPDGSEKPFSALISESTFTHGEFSETRFILPEISHEEVLLNNIRFAFGGITGPLENALTVMQDGRFFRNGHSYSISEQHFSHPNLSINSDTTGIDVVTDSLAGNHAAFLSKVLTGFAEVPEAASALPYLQNWNYRYDLSSAAASIIEGFYHHTAASTVRSYVSEPVFEELEKQHLIPREYALGIIESHQQALLQPGRFSPVNDGFLVRRVAEAVSDLERWFGTQSYEWRWSNLNRFSLNDTLICDDFGSGTKANQTICNNTFGGTSPPLTGNRNTLAGTSLAFGPERKMTAFTGLMLTMNPVTGQSSARYFPGGSADPLSAGFNITLDHWFANTAPETESEQPEPANGTSTRLVITPENP